MHVIGITGGVGAGKSTVLEFIESECDALIIKADDVCKSLELRGQRGYKPLVDLLGECILTDDLEIDKSKMAEVIFSDSELLNKVNGILHPLTKEAIIEIIEANKNNGKYKYCFIEAALLIESGYTDMCEETWYVYVNDEERIRRLMNSRNYSRKKCLDIIKKQLSEKSFRDNCDFTVDNSYDFSDTKKQIKNRLLMLDAQ